MLFRYFIHHVYCLKELTLGLVNLLLYDYLPSRFKSTLNAMIMNDNMFYILNIYSTTIKMSSIDTIRISKRKTGNCAHTYISACTGTKEVVRWDKQVVFHTCYTASSYIIRLFFLSCHKIISQLRCKK